MHIGTKWPVDVWRKGTVTLSGNWPTTTGASDGYAYVTTISGTIQPFEATDGVRNSQRFANVRHLIIFNSGEDIQASDEIVFKTKYERVAFVEDWDSDIISHLEVYTTESQWDRR